MPARTVTVVRCPKCGSTRAGSVEALYEFNRMRCEACGFEELCDEHQLKLDWNVRLELADGEPLPARLPPGPR